MQYKAKFIITYRRTTDDVVPDQRTEGILSGGGILSRGDFVLDSRPGPHWLSLQHSGWISVGLICSQVEKSNSSVQKNSDYSPAHALQKGKKLNVRYLL